VAEKEKTKKIVSRLSQNDVPSSVIGEVTDLGFGRKIVVRTGEKIELVRPISDHLWIALAKRF
jgi:hydrogenase maturation factor